MRIQNLAVEDSVTDILQHLATIDAVRDEFRLRFRKAATTGDRLTVALGGRLQRHFGRRPRDHSEITTDLGLYTSNGPSDFTSQGFITTSVRECDRGCASPLRGSGHEAPDSNDDEDDQPPHPTPTRPPRR